MVLSDVALGINLNQVESHGFPNARNWWMWLIGHAHF